MNRIIFLILLITLFNLHTLSANERSAAFGSSVTNTNINEKEVQAAQEA